MSRWFRSYADKHRNPKVMALTDREFRFWDQLLCVAAENDGLIPPLTTVKRLLNSRLDHCSTAVERLLRVGLIERSGDCYVPRNWKKRQYKSDTSNDRVAKFRKQCNGDKLLHKTDTETDTEPEKKEPDKSGSQKPAAGAAGRVSEDLFGNEPPSGGDHQAEDDGGLQEQYSAPFETWWSEYPNKTGKRRAWNEYELAFKRLGGAKAGTAKVHATLLHSVKAQVSVWQRKGIGGRFIPHPATWLHQSRWDDGEVAGEMKRARSAGRPIGPPPDVELQPPTPKPAKRETLSIAKVVGWAPGEER